MLTVVILPNTRDARYLAKEARYSADGYAHRHKSPEHGEVHQMLLVRAVLGVVKDYGTTVSEATKKLKMAPDDSDSVRGGPHQPTKAGPGENDSEMYVLYHHNQAYPEYVVSFVL